MLSAVKKRHLILHIGDPKTGSSSIQRALQLGLVTGENADLSVFTTDLHSANAVHIARGFVDGKGRKTRIATREVMKWLRSTEADFSILSSEFFSGANPELLYRTFSKVSPAGCKPHLLSRIIRRFFPQERRTLAQNMRVIAYVRPHPGRALAAFAERVRCGYTLHDFGDWLPQALRSDLLTYAPRFRQWQGNFGDQFTLRPFLRDELADGDVVVDFFDTVLGPKNYAMAGSVNENQSLSLRSLAGLLAFNREMANLGVAPRKRIPLARVISSRLTSAGDKPQLDSRSMMRIDRACREDARAMDAEFFGRPLFQNALDQAVKTARRDPIDLTFVKYFTPAQQAQVRDQAKALQGLIETGHGEWQQHYQANRFRHNNGQEIADEGGGDIQKRLGDLALLFR